MEIIKQKWSDKEEIFLKKNYENLSYEELQNYLGRTKESIKNKLKSLNLTKGYKRRTDSKIKGEIWKEFSLPELKITYLVSNFGRVCNDKDKILNPYIDIDGYRKVNLRLIEGKGKVFFVHRLVCLVFDYNENHSNLTVNHKDGNKENNKFSNLEWMTVNENIQHAIDTKLRKSYKGANNNSAKYSEKLIHNICKMIKDGYTNTEINNHYTEEIIDKKNLVSKIRMKQRWTEISDQYF